MGVQDGTPGRIGRQSASAEPAPASDKNRDAADPSGERAAKPQPAPSPHLEQARAHVIQFERRVERQKRLIETLERDKHVRMLDKAHVVLATLEQSLRLARQHLQIEISRHGDA